MSNDERRPILRSERIMLRIAERDDLPLAVEWLNDAEVADPLDNRAPMSRVAEEAWFEQLQKDIGRTRWHFMICLREDGRAIGFCGFDGFDTLNGNAELGVGIGDRTCWDKGYGTEAVELLLDFGFGELRLHRIWLHVFGFNHRAIRVYQKVGFTHEGIKREAYFRHGQHHDMHVMGILRDEWLTSDRPRSWELE